MVTDERVHRDDHVIGRGRFLPQTPWQWVRALWPGVLACVLVYFESNDRFSAEHTTGYLYPLLCKLFGYIDPEHWDVIHFEIRKAGHLCGFLFVGQCFYYCATHVTGQRLREAWQKYQRRCAFAALFCSYVLASADEFHQTFIPSRTGCLRDVVIDVSGALLGLVLRFGLVVFFKPARASSVL